MRRKGAQVVLLDERAQRGNVRREVGAALGDDRVAQLAAAGMCRVAGALLTLRNTQKTVISRDVIECNNPSKPRLSSV